MEWNGPGSLWFRAYAGLERWLANNAAQRRCKADISSVAEDLSCRIMPAAARPVGDMIQWDLVESVEDGWSARLRPLIHIVSSGPIALRLRLSLRFDLRIAHGLRQHLAQLSLGLWGFSLQAFLPLGHLPYVVMPGRELKPVGQVPFISAPFSARGSDFDPAELAQPEKGCRFARINVEAAV